MVFLGPYVSALEHHIQSYLPPTGHYLVKGLNISQRDQRMNNLMDYDCFIETDYARFDRRVSKQILQLVEFVCLTHNFNNSDYFNVLSIAWKTFGLSALGTTYTVEGTRCSGDAWTSIGNGLINKFLTWICLRDIPHVSYHEGDDGVIGIHRRNLDVALERLRFLDVLGFKAKIDVHHTLNTVSFCGRKLYSDGCDVRSYCDLQRSLAKFNTTVSEGDPEALLLAKAMSYNSTDKHTPIIGELTWSIISILKPSVSKRRLKRAQAHISTERYNASFENIGPPDVPHAARASACLTAGLSPSVQYAFESYYRSWTNIGFIPAVVDKLPADWDISGDTHVCLNDAVV